MTTIWIDLDNSPHVPFFAPIIEELEKRGYSLLVTARDCFQVCDLAKLLGVRHKRIGRHFGKHRLLKVAGLCSRALQLVPTVLGKKPDLAISHGSRAQLLVSAAFRVPSVLVMDYEFARGLTWMKPHWIMIPEVIPNPAIDFDSSRVLKYPGIKEDAYVPRFKPDPSINEVLQLNEAEVIVTMRPPATEAHYHVSESDALFAAAMNYLGSRPEVKMVLLPRNAKQAASLRESWPQLFETGKVIIPAQAVDGLNLVWHSDLVISGGGTMNREAAAMGVPVYSVFRGTIGAVDRYLAKTGRLILLETVEDVRTKLILKRRTRSLTGDIGVTETLGTIVDHIVAVIEGKCEKARN